MGSPQKPTAGPVPPPSFVAKRVRIDAISGTLSPGIEGSIPQKRVRSLLDAGGTLAYSPAPVQYERRSALGSVLAASHRLFRTCVVRQTDALTGSVTIVSRTRAAASSAQRDVEADATPLELVTCDCEIVILKDGIAPKGEHLDTNALTRHVSRLRSQRWRRGDRPRVHVTVFERDELRFEPIRTPQRSLHYVVTVRQPLPTPRSHATRRNARRSVGAPRLTTSKCDPASRCVVAVAPHLSGFNRPRPHISADCIAAASGCGRHQALHCA